MKMLLREIWRRDRLLAATGWFHVILFAIALVLFFVDSRTVLGINPWIKPMKFMISIAIFVWTVAWFLGPLNGLGWAKRLISGGISLAMVTETLCISLQSARGVTSHFNFSTWVDARIFNIMGIMIAINTLLAAFLLVLWCVRPPERDKLYVWGVRLGIFVFLLGSAAGGIMVAHRGHAVGVEDGGAGLPFVNWSTEAGDLRIAHFFGLHALQIIPLAAYALTQLPAASRASRGAALAGVALLYSGIYGFMLWWAWSGRPLIAM